MGFFRDPVKSPENFVYMISPVNHGGAVGRDGKTADNHRGWIGPGMGGIPAAADCGFIGIPHIPMRGRQRTCFPQRPVQRKICVQEDRIVRDGTRIVPEGKEC